MRGRSASRASSASSSPEVRCACQFYRSDSLLPERSALVAARPAARHAALRMVQTPPAGRRPPATCGDHEYEPIGTPALRMAISQHSMSGRLVAPVVKITDTDVAPVADSDDSIEDRYRFKQRSLILEGDVVLPLDGRIEDNAMESRNLGDQTLDNSVDELESPQQVQDRLEEHFLRAPSPAIEPKIDTQIDTSQVQSSAKLEEAVAAKETSREGLQQRLKTSAGKIRSRIKGIQKPSFGGPRQRAKAAAEKQGRALGQVAGKPPASPRANQKASRMERFRMALPERPRFSMPEAAKFQIKRPNIRMPERPKFHIDRSKFHIDASKFQMKRPNLELGKLRRARGPPSREPSQEEEAQPASRRNIFDFSTYPRPKLFERRARAKAEYVTSSPKESRAQSAESSATLPRVKRPGLAARWAQRFGETTRGFHEEGAGPPSAERAQPWRHPSLEQPRLSLKPQTSEEEDLEEKLPWENTERRTYDAEDEAAEDEDLSCGGRSPSKEHEIPYDKEPIKDPRLLDEHLMKRIVNEEPKKKVRLVEEDNNSMIDPEYIDEDQTEDEHRTYHPRELFEGSFPPVDPREFRSNSVELSEEEEDCSSLRSDREVQQSSGSSCERRRRGVIEELDSDEFFLRQKGISQEHMRFNLMSEIRDAFRPRNGLANESPPLRPRRTRSHRKLRAPSTDEEVPQVLQELQVPRPPERPKRDGRASLRRSEESLEGTEEPEAPERADSLSRHRIVYHADAQPDELLADLADEPLDDIVVLKPERRKSRSQSQPPGDATDSEPRPEPPVPVRRKRLRRDQSSSLSIRTTDSGLCNGYGDEPDGESRVPPTPPPTPPPPPPPERLDLTESPELQAPVPPKRTRSHSRTASVAPEDDRTSHGADSLPGDFGYADEVDSEAEQVADRPFACPSPSPPPRDSSSREPSLPGYAVIEKREKPPRPPPPRRKKQQRKFATAPRPAKVAPHRPSRAYSTLGPARPAPPNVPRSTGESMRYIETDYLLDEDDFHKDLRRGEVLSKMQGRPLPAPPRPPRNKRGSQQQLEPRARSPPRPITPDFSETVASTQTDPLPDDLVIEEEITTAKLVVTSSEVVISTERVPSPTSGSCRSESPATPSIPPLPAQQPRDAARRPPADTEESGPKAPTPEEPRAEIGRIDQAQLDVLRSALFSSDEPFRIPSLEVGDLKVERLSVSQLEAYKVAASEIDAIVVSATELSGRAEADGGIQTSLLQELAAIRNQLEAVAALQGPQSRPHSAMEEAPELRGSRSRSTSPSRSPAGAVRQTASPVKSLPPVISVTPDGVGARPQELDGGGPRAPPRTHAAAASAASAAAAAAAAVAAAAQLPQRAVISFSGEENPAQSPAQSPAQGPAQEARAVQPPRVRRSPQRSLPVVLGAPEPGVAEVTGQLLRAVRLAGTRSLRHLVDSLVSRLPPGPADLHRDEKVRRVELAVCALLVLVAGLIVLCLCTPRTVTHHHHWDYFNPPQ